MSTTSEILTPLSCRATAMEPQQPAKSEIDNGFEQSSQVLMHEDVCFYCNKKDQELVYCSFCPKSYHAHCLPPGTKITTPRWGCPSHKCMICGAATSKSRGKIYRCVLCPSAFCFTHLPEESEVLPNNPYNFMGYKTTSFLFIKCKPCLEKHPELRAKSTPDKRRRDGEDGFSSDEDGKANDKYKRRKIVKISEEDMATVPVPRPTLIKTEGTRTKPDIQLVEEIKQIINTRDLLQKDIADDLHVSQSIISQYLNNQARKNGWDALEAKLRLWTERVHKRGDEKRAPTTNTAAVTPARSESNTSDQYNRQEEHKDERWRNDNTRHTSMHNTSSNTPQNSSNDQQRSYWDSYTPVKNDGKKSASFTNYSAGPAMYGMYSNEGHMMMNGHAPSPLEQSYAMHQQFFKPAALTGHLNGNSSTNTSNNSPGNSSPATTPASNATAANNTPSIFNSPNVQLPPLVTHGNPYEYAAYPSPHMFRQPFPPQMNYPMQPVSGYAYLAQGFTPMPAYPIPSPQSNFLAPPIGTTPAHFGRHEEYFNNANANANNSSNATAAQQSSK